MSFVDDFFNDRAAAREAVVGVADTNPDEAARAIQISKVTGVPSIAVAQDLPSFERDAKNDIATDIINNNPALQEYINSNPMAARVSSDDWGTLDAVTNKVAGLSAGLNKTLIHTAHAFMEGVTEPGGVGSWMYRTPESAKATENIPFISRVAYTALGLPLEAISRVAGGLTKAAGPFVEQTYGNITGDFDTAKRLGREGQGIVEYIFNRLPEGVAAGPVPRYLANKELLSLADNAGPYIRAGMEPPVGIDPTIDKHKKDQAKLDGDELADLTKEVQQSTTRERSPELFADMLRMQTQANIYIPFETIAKLYGDKPVRPDDNLLGWVPGIQEQVRTMSLTGGDIVIPLADWLAKSDPTLAKDIHDNIRVRRGGFTIEEAKEFDELQKQKDEVRKEMADVEVFHGSPHSFDAFSIEKIGTGEGAQSYGHGLYFAEKKEVAASYSLAGRNVKYQVNGKEVSPEGIYSLENAAIPEAAAVFAYHQTQNLSSAIQMLKIEETKTRRTGDLTGADFYKDAIDILERKDITLTTGPNIYRARIRANPEQFLDWDKPFNEQQIRDVLAELKRSEKFTALAKNQIAGRGTWQGKTGEFIYNDIVGKLKDSGLSFEAARAEASKMLQEAGIPGIRYLDQGSRDATNVEKNLKYQQESIDALEAQVAERKAQGLPHNLDQDIQGWRDAMQVEREKLTKATYNYVLFDDSLVEILDRNGEAVNAVRKQAGLEPLAMAEPKPERLTLYHGTTKSFENLSPDFATNKYEQATFFSDKPDIANQYAEGEGGRVFRVSVDPGDLYKPSQAELDAMMQRGDFVQLSINQAKAQYRKGVHFELGEDNIYAIFDLSATERAKTKTTDRVPLEGEETRHYGRHTTAYVLPYKEWHSIEKIIDTEIDKLLGRVAPTAEHQGAQNLEMKGHGKVSGAYLAYNDRAPIILWSLGATDPFMVARHEAIHFLRDNDFFTEAEWNILREAAEKEGWLTKHQIEKTYTEESTRRSGEQLKEIQLEEAIAEEYATWAKNPENVKGALRQVFEKLHMFLVEIKEIIAKQFGYEPKAEELFQMVESGEIGSRYGQAPIQRREVAKAQKEVQGELDVTRQEDKAIFAQASAMGFTVASYKRYMALIQKRNLEDIQAQRERATALEKKKQSAEWRQESDAIEDDVRADLRNRPDIAATEFFRYGELYGEKIDGGRPKLDESLLTPEEKQLLPDQWYGPKGLHPDDAAGLFGYAGRAELIEKLAAFEAARGNIRPGEFFHRLVKAEVEKRMIEKYGELDQNILSAAEDHVLGITQMDLLHEETLALGTRSGAEISFTKEDVQTWAETRFNEANAEKVSAVRYLDDAGRVGRLAELALLKGDFAEAFRHKQAQYLSALMAKEAKAFEKETARFERLADRFSKREGPKTVEQEFTDQIQDLLRRAGLPVRRTAAELFEAFDRAGYQNLDQFVTAKVDEGWELAVQPYLTSQIKEAKNMSVLETREFRTAIRSLAHVGREVKQIELAGIKEDFDAFKEKVVNNISTLPYRPEDTQNRWFYKWDAMQTKMEEIVKDLDLRKQLGPLFDALIRPMAEAKHQEYSMLETLAKKFSELRGATQEWQKTLSETIPQDFFLDPKLQVPFDLSRQDMIGMMLNFGNKSNIEKFVKGWKGKDDVALFEQKLRNLFDQHATKEDWDFVQNIWDVFEMWRPQANEMYYQLSGVPPKWIDALPFTNAHGSYRGGYFPVIHSKHWSGIEAKTASRANVMLGVNYHRATPANHYTKTRTGYIDYVEFQGSIEQVAARMQQEIHDIAYRRPLIAAHKIISNKEIRAAIRHHYGNEYEAQLTPWMQKIASHYQMDEQAVSGANAILRRIRYNLIGHALPLNLKVLLSPSTGLINPVSFGSMLWNRAANDKLAHEKSKEIPHTFRNMDRDFRERLEATINAKGFTAFQADVLRTTFWPAVWAEQQFRVKTFATEYQNNLVKGMSDGDAAAAADSIVRERHGSAGLPDLPSIMSSNEAMKTYTMFYGFFNTMYNWQRQMPGQIRRGEYSNFLKTLYGSILIPSAFGALFFNQQKEGDSWFKTIGKALLLQPLATAVFAREVGSAIIEGFPSRTGLGGVLQAIRTSSGDIEKALKNKEVRKPIQHTANVVGLLTGMPLAQIGRTSQFSADVYRGKQRPRNFVEWFRGIVSGEARLKR